MERRSVSAVAALADDLRRSLYVFIRRTGRPVTREEAADNAGISRKLAAFHLDKLVRAGLLRADRRAPATRQGRRGRTPKAYEPAEVEIRVSIPQRRYDLVGGILVDAVAEGGDAERAALRAARTCGREFGSETVVAGQTHTGDRPPLGAVQEVLDRLGYETVPSLAAPGEQGEHRLVLRNCVFCQLAERQRELVCGINRAFIEGILHGLGDNATRAAPVPGGDDHCCVELRTRTPG